MASADELRSPHTGVVGSDVRGNGDLPVLSESESSTPGGGAAEIEIELSGSAVGYVLTKEPPSGMYVRARHHDHHTAAHVFHRDDAEGHDDGRWWWAHTARDWVSWRDIVTMASARDSPFVLEPLFPPPALPGCAPHGVHDERCHNPDIETIK